MTDGTTDPAPTPGYIDWTVHPGEKLIIGEYVISVRKSKNGKRYVVRVRRPDGGQPEVRREYIATGRYTA